MRYTYSRWDGSQAGAEFDPDTVMEALSDDLMSDGDLQSALQRLTRWGLEDENGAQTLGLQNLLQRLRVQRQQEIDRYTLDSVLGNVHERLADISATEWEGIQRRLDEAESADGDSGFRQALETVAQRKQEFLNSLPDDPGSALSSLADYEFLDDTAREKFQDLVNDLQQQVLQSHFQSMRHMLQDLQGEQRDAVREMLRDLNAMARDRMEGGDPNFRRFMESHGRHFPGTESFDALIDQLRFQAEQTESLLHSMTPDMRAPLESLMASILQDDELRRELEDMAEALRVLAPPRSPQSYPFSGTESLTMHEALDLMRHMRNLDDLERELKVALDSGSLDTVDSDLVRRAMGDEAHMAVERLKQLTHVLEEAGYIERRGDGCQLTARGIRRIGTKALHDIFAHLKRDAFGQHSLSLEGTGGDRAETEKPYEFGDPFLLDLEKTLMNAVRRQGPGTPVGLIVPDFEVFRTERLTQASTVLMLDMSRSMPLRGCFVAAKKVTLALSSLIRSQYPRDRLYVIGFSDFARELQPETLHQITWGDYVYGTNMQHGFVLARRLLGRHKSSNKQIILITDGEPTAHFEEGKVHFAYPPTFRTFQETLREVKRCTQEGIVINTFMLERSHYLADFVNQMTRINRGRAFFATPERLGDFILVDYVRSKRNADLVR